MSTSNQIIFTKKFGCFMAAINGFDVAGKLGLGRSIMPRGGDNPDTPHAVQEKVYYTLAVIGTAQQVKQFQAQIESEGAQNAQTPA